LPRSDPVRAGPWALGPAVAASNIVIAVMKIATRTAAVPETISSGRVSNTATSHSPRLLSSALQAAALCLLQSCGGACRMNGCNILTECAHDRLHGTGGAASRWRGLIEGGHRVAATSSLQALDRRRQQAYSAERRASASAEATIETIARSAAMAASSWRSVLE
jgi:hypothetical protein